MAERRYYRVAGHSFSVEAGEHLFALMTNYQPFRIGAEEAGETLFDLTVGSVPTEGEKTHVFTDTSDDDMPRIEVYRMATDWLFQVAMYKTADVACRLRVTEDMHLARLEMEDESTRFGIDNACMLLYAFTTAKRHTLEMHAAVVVRPGETEDLGYLFLGKSGTGKSTHACMWMDAFDDARLLNDDNPILRLLDNGEVRVYGSPWSGKTPCYINRNVRVGAIVKLTQAPHNKIRPLRLPEAYAYMLSSASGLKIVPDMMDALYDTISQLIQTVQVYGLECLPNTDAAQVCYRGVTSACPDCPQTESPAP